MSRRVNDETLAAWVRFCEKDPNVLPGFRMAVLDLRDEREEAERLREAITEAAWPHGEDGEFYCPWCNLPDGQGHGEWQGGPCPLAERGDA